MKHPSLDSPNPSEDVTILVHQTSPVPSDDLVTDSIFEPTEEIAVYLEDTSQKQERLDSLLTPFGMGSILLLILANGLLTWGQWLGTPASKPEPSAVSVENIPNLAPESDNSLSLNSLSTLTLPSVPSISPRVPTPTKPVVTTTQTQSRNLTEALLPPSIQPQLMPTYTVTPTVTPSDSHQSSTVTPPPPPQPITQIKPNPEPSPSATVQTTDSNQPTVSKPLQALTNEQMLEQLRQREEAPSSLSFQQRTRARLEAAQTGQNANELMQRQIQQQQQQQQSAPSSIIIDRSGTSINY